MAVDWNKIKYPALFTMLGALLILSVKNCSDNKKSRERDDRVAANIDTIMTENRDNSDTIKAYVEAIYDKTETIDHKIDRVQETADTILAHVEYIEDSCCGCNKNPVEKPRKKPTKRTNDTSGGRHHVADTVFVPVVYVPVENPTTPVANGTPIEATVRCKWVQDRKTNVR